MSGPDGPCEREADYEEYLEREDERIDQFERDADESRDDLPLLDIAQARMMSWFIDRVLP